MPALRSRPVWMPAAAALCLALVAATALAALEFPPLSGRVVDQAGLLSDATERELSQALAAHEQATGEQVVVVTLKSLQGTDIADYGYQLGRHWGIGRKGEDNGALLIVAPEERKVRIEVGYGLEGRLTDALSHQIIQTKMLPAFESGDMETGIVQGTRAVLAVLGGDKPAGAAPQRRERASRGLTGILFLIMVLATVVGGFFRSTMFGWGGYGYRRGGYYGGGFGGGGLGGGGGFSGGGGSFGGGGASGGW